MPGLYSKVGVKPCLRSVHKCRNRISFSWIFILFHPSLVCNQTPHFSHYKCLGSISRWLKFIFIRIYRPMHKRLWVLLLFFNAKVMEKLYALLFSFSSNALFSQMTSISRSIISFTISSENQSWRAKLHITSSRVLQELSLLFEFHWVWWSALVFIKK